MTEDVTFEADVRGSTLWITLAGEIDLDNSAWLDERIRGAIVPAVDQVVLDLSEVAFMDSSGLRVVLKLADRLHERRRELILVVPSEGVVRRVLTVSGAEAQVPIVASNADVVTLRPP